MSIKILDLLESAMKSALALIGDLGSAIKELKGDGEIATDPLGGTDPPKPGDREDPESGDWGDLMKRGPEFGISMAEFHGLQDTGPSPIGLAQLQALNRLASDPSGHVDVDALATAEAARLSKEHAAIVVLLLVARLIARDTEAREALEGADEIYRFRPRTIGGATIDGPWPIVSRAGQSSAGQDAIEIVIDIGHKTRPVGRANVRLKNGDEWSAPWVDSIDPKTGFPIGFDG